MEMEQFGHAATVLQSLHTLEKNGYIRCGTIHLTDGADRFVYEKVLE